ncbi:hypothetical protein GGI04_003955 [Coemansia thaxteri]|uniref:Uncharacterized protein n=1 Tax=Coemansia thaxteri TaxID=2663907 RepID=A0A9W8BCZ7_9FUNG|nr:hypothetical protein GGI04_003955 [Coemansia thaxteri]KAJ2001098.1 hypothetical protein H4R26_004304 [Coemansia thaxteri]KAJ2468576.1 hypothetical protein GGI02_003660 [Coemansia sp. RSA 2322]
MQHLTLRDHTGIVPDELPYIPHAVPFPKLVSLRIFVLHPFADDVLFRGNSDTLTYLSMIPDSVSINVLNRHNVFDAGRYSKLKFVVMNEIINEAVNTAVPAAILSNFLCKMAGPVQVLQMEMCADIKTLFAHPSLGEKGFQTLQILQARSSSLSLFDVLDLLKRLPALDSLYCGLAGLGSELDGIAPENLPEHVVSNYSNVGKNLKGWRVSFDRGTNHNTIAVYAMLLALVCPKFTKVDTPLMAMSDYCASISEALRSGTYLKYAPRLSRLLDAVK